MVPLLLLLRPVLCQTDMYHAKPWTPENVSPSVASFVRTKPTFDSAKDNFVSTKDNFVSNRPSFETLSETKSSSSKPTSIPSHNSYSQFAISGKPLVHHSNGLEDQESLETHSFVYLAPPPDHLVDPTKNNPALSGLEPSKLSPVLRVHNHAAERQPYSRDGDRRIDQVSMETQTKTRAREISSQKRWKEKARRAKQPRLSGSRQRATLNRAEKRTRTSETQVMPKIRRAPTKAATNRRRTKSRARTTHSVVPPRPERTGTKSRNQIGSTRRKASVVDEEGEEPVTLVNFGDWAAQWDELEEAWYYYNYFTGESTWNRPDQLKHIPFKNPFSNNQAEEQIEQPVPEGDVTGYSPPVTDDFQLPGLSSNKTKSEQGQGNLSNHQLKENLEKHLLKVNTKDNKVNPSKSQQKGKRGKTKHPVGKKQATGRKAEKGKGKDYGWLDFLGLPKMKLPDFLDFSTQNKKAPRASDAAPQPGGEKGVRGKRRVLKKNRLTPGLRGCYTRIHELLNLC